MRMAIQGIGISGSFGTGVAELGKALEQGFVQPQQATVERNTTVDSFPLYRASVEKLADFFPKRALRRIDHFSKMTLLSACLALQDADLFGADLSGTGVIIASGYGALRTTFDFLDSYLDFGYSCSSPTHFSNSVHNAAAAHVSMQLKATAPSLTVTQFEMSVGSALLTAKQWLAKGRVERVLFGCIDEYCDVLRYCRDQFFGGGEQGPIQPLDFDQQTAVPGEGSVFFVLSGEGEARYASVDSVVLGNHLVKPVSLPSEEKLIIGADGHKECGRMYSQVVKNYQPQAYAPLYGSFPAAAGFDLAVAALSLQNRTLRPCPRDDSQPSAENRELGEGESLSCLKFGPGGDYSLIKLIA